MLKHMKIWQKFTMIAVAFTLPVVVLLYLLVNEQNDAIAFTKAEKEGIVYVRPLQKLLIKIQTHRDMHIVLLKGDKTFDGEIAKLAGEIDANIAEVDKMDQKYGLWLTTDQVSKVKTGWAEIRALPSNAKPQASFEVHTRAIKEVTVLMTQVGNASNLILDPNVDSEYVMDAMIFKMPKLAEEVSQARAAAGEMLANGNKDIDPLNRSKLFSLTVRIEDTLNQARDSIMYGFAFNPKVDSALRPDVKTSMDKTTQFTKEITEKLVSTPQAQTTLGALYATANEALSAFDKQWESSAVELERLLDARIAGFGKKRITSFGAVALALALTILLLIIVVRAITKPIAHLSMIAEKISLGDLDAKIEVDTKDEIGELSERFRRLQVSLKAAMDQLEARDAADGG
jgi:HAMP domain-containing protein